LRGPGKLPIEIYREHLRSLEDEADKLEAAVSTRSAEFRAQAQPVTVETIQEVIPKNTALVEIMSYKPFNASVHEAAGRWWAPRYVAYVLRGKGEPAWVDLVEAEPIDREVETRRGALGNPARADIKDLARSRD